MNKEQYERLRNSLLSDTSINKYNRDLFKKFFEWEEVKIHCIRQKIDISDWLEKIIREKLKK